MLVAAALVPSTALLVPGASGAAEVLADVRAAALAAAATLVAAEPQTVVVIPPGPGPVSFGRLRPTLAAAGIDDDWLEWSPRPTAGSGAETLVDDVASAVGLFVLDRAGWTGSVELAPAGVSDGAIQRMRGHQLAARGRTAFLLVGGLSARHGPDGPLPTSERASAVDDAVLADLADLRVAARGRLASVPSRLAALLAVSAWGPWQTLLGAVPGAPAEVVLHDASAPFGAAYVTVSWRWT